MDDALVGVLGTQGAGQVYSLVGPEIRERRVPPPQLALMWVSENMPMNAERILAAARSRYRDTPASTSTAGTDDVARRPEPEALRAILRKATRTCGECPSSAGNSNDRGYHRPMSARQLRLAARVALATLIGVLALAGDTFAAESAPAASRCCFRVDTLVQAELDTIFNSTRVGGMVGHQEALVTYRSVELLVLSADGTLFAVRTAVRASRSGRPR